jgi:hypothetical protein
VVQSGFLAALTHSTNEYYRSSVPTALTARPVDRNEVSGAFADIRTDLPLIVGMILAAKLHPAERADDVGLDVTADRTNYGLAMPARR